MDREQIIHNLDELVREVASESCDNLKGKNLVEDLGYDSVSLMELIAELEEHFWISVEGDMMLESFDNYDNIVECVLELISDEVQ